MHTLVDLLSNEHGCARIYADAEGFGYELLTYLPRPTADLFRHLGGFASLAEACVAAEQQLASMQQVRARRRAPSRRSRPHSSPPVQTFFFAGHASG